MPDSSRTRPGKSHTFRGGPGRRLQRLDIRIGLAIGALILLLALALAIVLARSADREILNLGSSNLEGLSEQMGRELSAGMDRFARDVQTQALRDRFRGPVGQRDELRLALDNFKRVNPEFTYAAIVDADSAQVIAATGGIFEGGSVRGRPVFDKGLTGPFVGDVHDAVRLAELLPKPASGETLRFLDVSAPIQDASGKVTRVFIAHVGWEWTNELRADVFGPLRERRGIEAFLVDTAGKVVLSGSPKIRVGTDLSAMTRLVGQPASKARWPDGQDEVTYAVATHPHGRFPGFGWKVIARQPYAAVAAPAAHLRNAFVAGALGLGLLGSLIAWWLAVRLVRPVRLLAQAARRAQDGESVSMLAGDYQLDEVVAVRDAFAKLSDNARVQADASQASQRQFAALAESLPQVVWQADAAGAIDYVNKDWVRRLVTERARVADLAQLLLLEDRANYLAAWSVSLATNAPMNVRCRIHVPDQPRARWFDVVATAVHFENKPTRWIGTLFDVHEIVTHAKTMQRALADERNARIELERLSRLRNEFLATVSHELRSPLSAISGWSEILARKADSDPMVLQAATVIRRNAQLQARLINDLLDMNAVTAGKMVLDVATLDLTTLARETFQAHLLPAQKKGVELVFGDGAAVAVDADAKRLSQVLSNLVGNALKFTDAGGRIELHVHAADGDAHLSVRDTGRGMSPDFLPNAFERLRQEDSSITRSAGGLGLGLAISKALVELHQGRISAYSAGIGQGSTFALSLPLAALDPKTLARTVLAPDQRLDEDIDLSALHILLVDDESDARQVAQFALTSLGARVTAVASAAQVLEALARETFDVLVSDIGMPGMDGLQLIGAVRQLKNRAAGTLPAVALTAFAMESDRVAGLAAGFDAYVDKPISLRRLSEGILSARLKARAVDSTTGQLGD